MSVPFLRKNKILAVVPATSEQPKHRSLKGSSADRLADDVFGTNY